MPICCAIFVAARRKALLRRPIARDGSARRSWRGQAGDAVRGATSGTRLREPFRRFGKPAVDKPPPFAKAGRSNPAGSGRWLGGTMQLPPRLMSGRVALPGLRRFDPGCWLCLQRTGQGRGGWCRRRCPPGRRRRNHRQAQRARGQRARGRNARGRNAKGRNAKGRNAKGRNARGDNAQPGPDLSPCRGTTAKGGGVLQATTGACRTAADTGCICKARTPFGPTGARQGSSQRPLVLEKSGLVSHAQPPLTGATGSGKSTVKLRPAALAQPAYPAAGVSAGRSRRGGFAVRGRRGRSAPADASRRSPGS